jgi:hypothetical protein
MKAQVAWLLCSEIVLQAEAGLATKLQYVFAPFGTHGCTKEVAKRGEMRRIRKRLLILLTGIRGGY